MTSKLLADLEFSSLIGEAAGQTATGCALLDKYKAHVMATDYTCRTVNQFVSEASNCRYDNGVNDILEKVADYIQMNKTSWALTSVCENLKNNMTSYNYLNKSAIEQVEKLLESDEDTVNKYIKAGALKNVMYVTEFRNIAKQVYHDMPMVESSAEYTVTHPISFVESCGDGMMFEVASKVIKINSDKTISEGSWDEVSNTFRVISSLLESNICSYDEVSEGITVKYNNVEYFINENEDGVPTCTKTNKKGEKKTLTVEQLRDDNRLVLKATNPRYMNTVAGVLEAIALTYENFKQIAKLDNTGIYETKSDKFIVVNEGTNMYATLLQSNHSGGWTYNCNVVEALESIKKSTRVTLSENYTEQVKAVIEQTSEEEKQKIAEQLKDEKKQSIKERIEALTEKFKDDPTKLAVLSQIAQDLQTAEE